ncbi:MAG: YggS family pyridoxal phosphate-dependent enzyme [Pseudomonadota bacterium]
MSSDTVTDTDSLRTITARFGETTQIIAKAVREAKREADAVTLVAVSKVQPDHRIDAALKTGHRVYGENRVQEAQERWTHRRAAYPDLRLHLIGPLQTNKAKDAVALFDVIESIDREKLARKLADEMTKQDRQLTCYLQVNTGAEEQKAGALPGEQLVNLHRLCTDELGLTIAGLMCIPPVDEPAAMHFGLLADWAKRLGVRDLSMGMSADYELAIRMGATSVRIGSAVFGEREKPA